ncbi:MAG: signal recognition particle-docking protein FtsY [Ignavibacteriales bacterium]|nr:signal recognition particle-docking protein FtsY [Ignavibacteriales bacterium]
MGIADVFSKFKIGLGKTRENIIARVQQIVSLRPHIDDELFEQLEEALVAGDVGVTTTVRMLNDIKRRAKEERIASSGELLTLLKDEMAKLLRVSEAGSSVLKIPSEVKPFVIMVVGVNGVGKTTTIGKLAHNYKQAGYDVVIGAADTFRAAANEQLEVWAQRAGVDIVQQSHGADPAAVAYDAIGSAVAKKADIVIIDTAGRLHTKTNLMEELKKIKRVMEKRLPGAPHEVLLVLDASTGQNGLQQVRHFSAAVEVTGLILTKLDGTAKGGIVLAINQELRVPVKFIGVGEKIDDLEPFDRQAFLDAFFAGAEEKQKIGETHAR